MIDLIKDGWHLVGAEIPPNEYVWVIDHDGNKGIGQPLFYPFRFDDGKVVYTEETHDGTWGGLYNPEGVLSFPEYWKKIDCKFRKLCIFDMDGTLIATEPPESGKQKWFDKTGEPWPHSGWWGRRESLNIDIFDNELIMDTVSDLYDESKNETSLLVLMTGRHKGLTKEVDLLLDKHGLKFHEKKLNDRDETIVCKIRQIDELLFKYPLIEEIEIWEDRPEHIEVFTEKLKRFSYKFKINLVGDGNK